MVGTPRILAVLAQPGDESWAFGPVLARYVAEGARVHLLCATRGENRPFGSSSGVFPPAVLGRMREREMEEAARVLGLHEVETLGCPDGSVASVDPFRLQMDVAARIRRARPQVVLTWGPQGPEGDADRTAVSDAVQGAVLAAARHSAPVPGGLAPHAVRKVYQRVWSRESLGTGSGLPGESPEIQPHLLAPIPPSVPRWMVSTVVCTEAYARQAREAVACHRSRPWSPPTAAPDVHPAGLEASGEFMRSLSTVGVPAEGEGDLLAGIWRRQTGAIQAA